MVGGEREQMRAAMADGAAPPLAPPTAAPACGAPAPAPALAASTNLTKALLGQLAACQPRQSRQQQAQARCGPGHGR